ncbi:two-component system nitrogen regulation sensor histidine kinase NtrY [Sphingomonas sp. SORGH_AS802]|uniref:sensor histidine kinase n=1 Tax=unclassified Sphingomonas TaxID=196159 RepID=UPI002866789A|nr:MULTISPECIES: ATP-binding protein [unclassified Sphingomonas]MDR6128755.1 two-component system nitrogen regulation sensor histidine kinase NtrY [Sphingomonas sp. SORGH_AS_0438]MDR6136231.1 two-component system nitrogen regulation sensor histidine kinase NtrY [Sphingomonas sp. SORGH_AS_0802]
MASERLAATVRTLVLLGTGAAAALSVRDGLYANTVLTLLLAAWTGGVAIVAARPLVLTPPPPPPALDQEELRRLRTFLDLSPAPLVVNEDGVLTAVNRAARRLFLADVVITVPPPSLVEALMHTPPGRTATVTLDEKGTPRTFALAVGDLLLNSARAQVVALIDIGAEIKAAEAAALRDLVQVLSHEIVNALTPIASLAETATAMLDDEAPDVAGVREAVGTVARRAAGLQRFGDAYRSLARLPAPEPRRVAIADLLGDLSRLFAVRWPDIPVLFEIGPVPAAIHCDPDQLNQALWAMLQNAAEAIQSCPGAGVTLAAAAGADSLAITITNGGSRIAPELADAIFQPFMTTKQAGSGIGLTLARQIVRGHGGEISLLASEEDGTRFAVVLPRV